MGKLMLWLSTADIDHRSVIMDIWADPKSTILDLIKQVGVSQSTVDFYVDRLSADWAVRRHARLLSKIHRHHPFRAFLLVIENNLRLDYRIEAVDSKISQKLMGGYYGQISDALFQTLPVQFRNHPDNFLNMDTCDYGRFADKVIADAGVSITPEPKVRMDNSPNTTSPQILVQAPATPSAFNILPSSGLEDPFTHTSDRPTSLGSLRYPKTLDGSNILPYGRVTNHSRNGSDGSRDLQSSTTDVCDRTSAVSALSLSPDWLQSSTKAGRWVWYVGGSWALLVIFALPNNIYNSVSLIFFFQFFVLSIVTDTWHCWPMIALSNVLIW
jgi:hypothetical protein